jgi:hypothetical protein
MDGFVSIVGSLGKPSSMKKEWTSCDHRWSLGEPSSNEKEMYG